MNEFNITIQGGTSKRLPTAGKYCERDIIVTATGGAAPADTMVGTWEFNENLGDIPLDGFYPIKISKEDADFEINGLTFYQDGDEYVIELSIINDPSIDYDNFYLGGDWYYDRTITILEEPTDPELIAWIKANARKRGDDSMVGTWIFNEVLDLPEFDYYFNFVLTNVADAPRFYNLYSEGDGILYYFDVDDGDTVPYENGAWIYPEYRTITITEEPTDAECIAWLKANARKATYEDGFAEGEKAILSTYVDWSVSSTSSICIVDFNSDCDYYARIYVYIADPNPLTDHSYEEWFVLEPYGSYSIDTEEVIGTSALSGQWSVVVVIEGFSKDGEF